MAGAKPVPAVEGRRAAAVGPVVTAAAKALAKASPADLPGVIYNSDSEPVDIAPLAELVDEAAREGDEVAREILAAAGRELGRLARSVIEKLNLNHSAFRVACVGSVFRSGEILLEPFRDAVHGIAPLADVGPPLDSPAMGAVKLAQMQGVDA